MLNRPVIFQPLVDFYERLPNRPYYGLGKRIAGVMPKGVARYFPYIQINFPRLGYLCFDCDSDGAAFRPLELDIPGPTLTVINRDNGHAHIMYQLRDPIPCKRSPATKKLLRYVILGYAKMLDADRCITAQKQLVKNPLHRQWEVIEGYKQFSLTELSESIPPEVVRVRYLKSAKGQVNVKPFEKTLRTYSRNCSLFESGRFFAYGAVEHCGSQRELYEEVLSYISELNVVEIPRYFPEKGKVEVAELRYIAKSISTWTYTERLQIQIRIKEVKEGVMNFEPIRDMDKQAYEDELKIRQSLSAKRTHAIRRQDTKRRILDAINNCADHGLEPTVSNIGALSGLSKQTVYNHIELIEKTIAM